MDGLPGHELVMVLGENITDRLTNLQFYMLALMRKQGVISARRKGVNLNQMARTSPVTARENTFFAGSMKLPIGFGGAFLVLHG